MPLIEEDAVSFSDGVPVAWNREEVPVSLLKPQKATQYRKDTSSSDVRPKGAHKASPGIASKTEILAPMNATSDVFKFDEQGNLYKLYHEASPSSSFLPSEYEKADDIRQRHRGFTRCLDPHAIGDQAWHHPVRTVRERSRPPISTQPQKYDISTPRRSPAAERVAGHAAPTEDREKPPVAAQLKPVHRPQHLLLIQRPKALLKPNQVRSLAVLRVLAKPHRSTMTWMTSFWLN